MNFINVKNHFRLLIKAAVIFVFLLLARIWSALNKSRKQREAVDVTIVKVDALGDLVIHAGLFKELQRYFSEKGIAYQFILDKRHEQILAELGLNQNVVFCDRTSTVQYFRTLYRILNQASKKVINLHHTRPSVAADPIAWSLASEVVIATQGITGFDQLLKVTGRSSNTKFIRHHDLREIDFSWALCVAALRSANFTRKDFGLDNSIKLSQEPEIVFVLGAGQIGRCWGWENYLIVVERILTSSDCRVSVIGQVDRLECPKSLVNNPRVTWAVNQLSLRQYFALLRKADIVIANDSSATHIASYLGKRVVAIYGGGHYERFRPNHRDPRLLKVLTSEMECFNCNWSCRFVDIKKNSPPCIAEVSPADVEDALLELIHENNDNHNCF